MKLKKMLCAFVVICMVLAMLPVTAAATETATSGAFGDTLTWSFDEATGTLTISGTGDMPANSKPWSAYAESITSVVIEPGVTSIGHGTFSMCSLTSISIPNTVTEISDNAFGMSCLESIVIPDSVTEFGIVIFNDTPLADVTLPSNMTIIPTGMFSQCSKLTAIEIPESVTTISLDAFTGTSLTQVTIPANVTCIESAAFHNLRSECDVIFVGNAPEFGEDAFSASTITVYHPKDNTTWDSAIAGYLPADNAVTWVGYSAGEEPWNEPAYVASGECGENLLWTLDANGTLTISGTGDMYNFDSPMNETAVPEDLPPWYLHTESIKEVVVCDGVTSIGDSAFDFCLALTAVTLPDSVTSIGTAAFSTCPITTIDLPANLTTIENAAFSHSGLTSIVIPDSVTSLGEYVFNSCGQLTSAKLPAGLTSISDYLFYCSSVATVEIPDSVTTIGENAFYSCGQLKAIDLPDNLTEIGYLAFASSGLETITVPGSVKTVGGKAFWGCNKLTEVILEEGVEEISSFVFGTCSSMETVIIPASVKIIGGRAFDYQGEGVSYYFQGDIPKADSAIFIDGSSDSFFSDVTGTAYYPVGNETWTEELMTKYSSDAEITWVPYAIPGEVACGTCGEDLIWSLSEDGTLTILGTGDMEDYSSAVQQPWYDLQDQITAVVVKGTVSSVGAYNFYGLPNLVSVTIEDGVTSIGGHSMKYCPNLTSVTIPASVTEMSVSTFYGSTNLVSAGPIGSGCNIQFGWTESIPAYAFDSASDLQHVILPEGITVIGDCAFLDCFALTEIDLPDSLISIGKRAFEDTALTSVVIPDGVTIIDSEAFQYCPLTSVQLSANLTKIGASAFSDCTKLTSITIPGNVSDIALKAFSGCEKLTEIIFRGAAPVLHNNIFNNVTATAYYRENDSTWTEDVMQNYGGEITWVEYCPTTPMYRLYNPNSGEHFYTGSVEERENLVTAGWQYEGISWNAPMRSGEPVYRLYNPNSGDHHYTMSADERDNLVDVGWKYEGVAWNSAPATEIPLYRLYNPNADCGSHHYTGSTEECDFLVSVGWILEGIGWFGMLK